MSTKLKLIDGVARVNSRKIGGFMLITNVEKPETLKIVDLNKCLELATKYHKGQKRRDGTEYINHPITVSKMIEDAGYSVEYQAAALFHDLLEDTACSEFEILAVSTAEVLEAVKLVTKRDDVSEEKYIELILANPIAKVVKNYDRIHNLMDALNSNDEKFVKRYLNDTLLNYVGEFSDELDLAYCKLAKKYLKTGK